MSELDPRGVVFTEVVLEVFRVNGLLLEAGDGLARPVGLTSSRWQVLGVVDHGPASVAQVARVMGLSRQSVQRTADLLAGDGLIEYVQNPHHRRAKLMKMTPEGKKALDYIEERQTEWANRIGEEQSLEDLRTMAKVLRRLGEKLSRDTSAVDPEDRPSRRKKEES